MPEFTQRRTWGCEEELLGCRRWRLGGPWRQRALWACEPWWSLRLHFSSVLCCPSHCGLFLHPPRPPIFSADRKAPFYVTDFTKSLGAEKALPPSGMFVQHKEPSLRSLEQGKAELMLLRRD